MSINLLTGYNRKTFLIVFILFQTMSVCFFDAEHVSDKSMPHGAICVISHDETDLENSTDSRLDIIMQSPFVNYRMSKTQWREHAQKAITYDIFCRNKFGMGSNELNNVTWLGYDDFLERVFCNPNISDQAARNLAEEYLCRWGFFKISSRVNRFKKKVEDRIAQKNEAEGVKERVKPEELDCQNKAIAIEQEVALIKAEEKRLLDEQIVCEKQLAQEEKYNLKILQNLDYASPYQAHREAAFQKTVNQGYANHVQTHMVDDQTAGILQAEGIDHKQLRDLAGTVFQHQLFKEVAQHYKNAAKIMFEYSIKNSCMVPHILEFAQSAFDATRLEQVGLAVQLSDVAGLLAETSLSICKGQIESLCGLTEALYHPKRTAKQLGQALVPILRTLVGAMVEYDHECSGCVTSMQAAQQVFGNDLQSFNQMCDLSKHAFYEWSEHSSGQDKIQVASKVMSDVVLQPFLIGKAGKACWGLLSQARELQVLEGLTCLSEELGFIEIAQDLAQLVSKEEGFATTVGEVEAGLEILIEAEAVAVQTPRGFLGVVCEQSFIENVKQLQSSNAFYKNISLQKQAVSYFDQYFYQKELLEFCAGVEKTHGVMIVQHFGKEVKMLCNPRHMMTYQLDFRNIASLGQAEGLIGGGHVGLFYDDLISKGFLKVVQDVQLSGGCRALELGHVFGKKR